MEVERAKSSRHGSLGMMTVDLDAVSEGEFVTRLEELKSRLPHFSEAEGFWNFACGTSLHLLTGCSVKSLANRHGC